MSWYDQTTPLFHRDICSTLAVSLTNLIFSVYFLPFYSAVAEFIIGAFTIFGGVAIVSTIQFIVRSVSNGNRYSTRSLSRNYSQSAKRSDRIAHQIHAFGSTSYGYG